MRIFLTSLLICVFAGSFFAQRKRNVSTASADTIPLHQLYSAMEFRNIGPFRGGRSAAVTGVPGRPDLYYFGAAGGGIWRTLDGGQTWENISDGYFGGSIGAIAVSEDDPNVIYVGGGEKTVRGNVSYGYGVWKSENAGKSWTEMGLENSRHISRIRVHPRNHEVVFAAVMGDLFKSSNERGVYKSTDGGRTWRKTLFANADAGAVDLTFDPTNPRILYASTWRIRRTPYSLSSGGDGSQLWKSTDGGETWTDISRNEGLPQKDTLGIIGITVSPQNGERLYAVVEAKDGGVFTSANGGRTWSKVNSSRSLRQRAWYYSRIYADPQDEETVYVLNVRWHKSTDGGRSFKSYRSEHSDHHDLWLDPENPQRMILGDDGGAQVSTNGGETWTTYYNQPTAQFYRVTTDDHFPYRIYAAQQDNSTVRISSRSNGYTIDEDDWESTAGCECGHIAVDPRNNEVVYGGCYDGYLQRLDHRTGLSRAVSVWPDNPMGHGAEDWKYRFQWNFPIFISPHDPNKLYTASNHLHLSTNEGQSWETISPDLTRNDPSKLKSSGGPITQDNTSVEYYCTIFAACEDLHRAGILWAGSDDGLLHVSTDAGANWTKVTPPGMPEWTMINSIEPHPTVEGGLYVAATGYKQGDYRPYLYRTLDLGKTWTKITDGIPADHFTRVVRADPNQAGFLYAGTESGLYISRNDGASWQPFQLNLPIVPITDLTMKDNDLIVATQGRAIWVLDDLSPLYQYEPATTNTTRAHLFQPEANYRFPGGGSGKATKTAGGNTPAGVPVYFTLPKNYEDTSEVVLTFADANGNAIQTFSTKAKKKDDPEDRKPLKVEPGSNRFVWNTRYPDAEGFDGMILWWAGLSGAKAIPGNYQVSMSVGGQEIGQHEFELVGDPRSPSTAADYRAQFEFMNTVSEKTTEAHTAIKDIRSAREQINNFIGKLDKEDDTLKPLRTHADSMLTLMKRVEENLYQTKNRSGQDPLNFPIRLTNKLAHLNSLVGQSDYPPTAQAIEVRDMLIEGIDAELAIWETVKGQMLAEFNRLVRELEVDAVRL